MQQPTIDSSLSDWLAWLEELHPVEIDLGLTRVREVAQRLNLLSPEAPVILVGGTNGKGSTVNLLANAYRLAGYKTAVYTSPHIETFNERMAIAGHDATDEQIVKALVAVEHQRGSTSLTYFEFTTLAAMQLFQTEQCDIIVLEVGLGGRLDATNLWDADCAIVTSIALDHQAYLGNTRESVAHEKVAIGRANKPLIVGEPDPPGNMRQLADEAGMNWIQIPESPELTVALNGAHQRRNAACAVEAIASLQSRLPVSTDVIDQALASDALPGRFQLLRAGGVLNLLDVAHNPAAAAALAATISEAFPNADIHLVIGIMADKDVEQVLQNLRPIATNWFSTALPQPRALPSAALATKIQEMDPSASVTDCQDIADAWQRAQAIARSADSTSTQLVVIVGSFFMLSALHEHWQANVVDVSAAGTD